MGEAQAGSGSSAPNQNRYHYRHLITSALPPTPTRLAVQGDPVCDIRLPWARYPTASSAKGPNEACGPRPAKRVDHDQGCVWTTTKAACGPRPRARVNHDQQRVWNRTSEGSVESRTELERLTANVAIVITKRRDRYQERVDAARQRCQERGRCQEQVDAARSESSLPREADDDSPEHRGRRSDRQARQRQRKGNPTSKLQDRDGA